MSPRRYPSIIHLKAGPPMIQAASLLATASTVESSGFPLGGFALRALLFGIVSALIVSAAVSAAVYVAVDRKLAAGGAVLCFSFAFTPFMFVGFMAQVFDHYGQTGLIMGGVWTILGAFGLAVVVALLILLVTSMRKDYKKAVYYLWP